MRIGLAIAILVATRPADAKGCHEVSDVVGLQHCSRYGLWSRDAEMPRLWVQVDYFHHRFMAAPFTLGTAALSTSPQPVDLSNVAEGAAFRTLVGIGPFLYVGGEMLVGGISQMPRIPGNQPNDSVYMGMHSVVGAHVERYRFALSGELAAGFRAAGWIYCVPGTDCKGVNDLSEMQAPWELQGRLRVDAYIHPNWSIGVTYGLGLLDSNDRMVMVGTAIHARVMDGMW
jgi:hypothetical protein